MENVFWNSLQNSVDVIAENITDSDESNCLEMLSHLKKVRKWWQLTMDNFVQAQPYLAEAAVGHVVTFHIYFYTFVF